MGGKLYKLYKFSPHDQWPDDSLYLRTWDANDGFFDYHIIVPDSVPPYENRWCEGAIPTVTTNSSTSYPHLDIPILEIYAILGKYATFSYESRSLEMHKVRVKKSLCSA